MSALAQLTALKALAVPDGYRGADGDLLRAAAPVLPSLTALHLPRLSATRPELQVRCGATLVWKEGELKCGSWRNATGFNDSQHAATPLCCIDPAGKAAPLRYFLDSFQLILDSQALERLPMLQHVTLGSVDVAPDEDYEGLDLPYGGYGGAYGGYGSCRRGSGGRGTVASSAGGTTTSTVQRSSPSHTALDAGGSGLAGGGMSLGAVLDGASTAPGPPVTFLRPRPLDPWSSGGGGGGGGIDDGDPWAAGPFGAAASPRSRPLDGSLPPTPGSAGGSGAGGRNGSRDGGGAGAGGGDEGGDGQEDGRPGVLRGMGSWRALVLCGEQRMEALVAAGPLPPQLAELRVEQLRWPK